MKNLLLIIVISSVLFFVGCDSVTKPGEQESITFNRYFIDDHNVEGNDAIQMDDGGYFVLGTGKITHWQTYLTILKTDPLGNKLWQISDSSRIFTGVKLVRASNGNMIALANGDFPNRIYTGLFMFDTSGRLLKTLPLEAEAGYSTARSVVQTRDGGFLVYGTGNFTQVPKLRAMLWKVSAALTLEWKFNTASIPMDCTAYSVLEDDRGGYLIASAHSSTDTPRVVGAIPHLIKLDASRNVVWERSWDRILIGSTFRTAIPTMDGGFLYGGYTYHLPYGPMSLLLVKIDSEGNEAWTQEYLKSSPCELRSILQNKYGDYIVSGYMLLNRSLMFEPVLLCADNRGRMKWAETYGYRGFDYFNSVSQTRDGGYILSGWLERDSTGALAQDILLVKVDGQGHPCVPIIKPR